MSENVEANEELRLAGRAMGGSEAALSALYDRYADPLFAFIYHRLGGHHADAEDVFQDTWMAALRSLRTYRGKTRIFFWLCGIARHKIADLFPRHTNELGGRGPPISGEALNLLIDEAPLAESLLARLDTRTLVVEALALLSEDYRSVLIARYIEECSVAEIAERLERTYKATESLLSRARAALREALLLSHRGEWDE